MKKSISALSTLTVAVILASCNNTPAVQSGQDNQISQQAGTYLVRGTDMGPMFQNIRVTNGGVAYTGADVRVNTINMPHTSSGLYQGNLGFAVAVGNGLSLDVRTPDGIVHAQDWVPGAPVVTAPVASTVVNSATPLPVAWNNSYGLNPDRFVVSATWSCGVGCGTGWTSPDLPGTARNYSIPAGKLPADKAVKIRVYAYNDGTETFSGPAAAGSRMAIRNGNEAGIDISTAPANSTICTSWGDPHLTTCDGLGVEFQSTGEFDLSMSTVNPFRVQVRQRPWGGSSTVSVNTAVATSMNGFKAGIYIGAAPNLRMGPAGTPTAVPAGGLNMGGGYTIHQAGNKYTFSYPGGEKMEATLNGSYIDVKLILPPSAQSRVKGLLGNFDGNTANDFALRSGVVLPNPIDFNTMYTTYASSWRVPSLAESLFYYGAGESFGGFTVPNFPSALPAMTSVQETNAKTQCQNNGVVDPLLLQGCAIDLVQTGNPQFITSAKTAAAPITPVKILLPDLKVALSSPTAAHAGEDISSLVKLTALNVGNGTAKGTLTAGANGYMLDLMLSTDTVTPNTWAIYSPNFSEDVLLLGGRASNTQDLAAGASQSYPIGATIPKDTPTGYYYLCAKVDPGNKVTEWLENNNATCNRIFIQHP
ncbi:VWD domain-containing protein [Deinococcus cellulosilyticus]|uniref:VWFD domain-containing protein n=1 Tax=Deinococcus cellulosilyticus (strain DSM 18568 / NBRC 106333 / KACC 11606 / 5516J-15) TaxID=1223518 RepID=A0A511N6X3_DEIC1|nr:VWD domain-containing protein [Deinococcus cellulosilyticus]GEM48227.1 hypothetical protein DC3_38620 [Deinococcus cellulosilyticus NBRC 106333 = KACC 11606]